MQGTEHCLWQGELPPPGHLQFVKSERSAVASRSDLPRRDSPWVLRDENGIPGKEETSQARLLVFLWRCEEKAVARVKWSLPPSPRLRRTSASSFRHFFASQKCSCRIAFISFRLSCIFWQKKWRLAFLSSPAILKRIFELKNSEFSCEIKFWKSLHFCSEKLRICYQETKENWQKRQKSFILGV